MKKQNKRIFKGRLSFSKAELLASQVDLSAIGINLPAPPPTSGGTEALRKEFGVEGNIQLGSMWGSMNDPKYYENVNASSIVPKSEDFIEVPFRLLSATTVGAGTWKATDFSDEKMLERSVALLAGKPVYKDHETDLDNWVGIIRGTKWEEAKMQGGTRIPAGINGLLAIDAKTNPKTARGLLLGSIFSNSVTVEFEWEMSHNFENEWDFYDKLGQIGSDGKMIRRVVKSVTNYHETSLVWLGADPFAKALDENGNLKHIDTGSVYEYAKASFSKSHKEAPELTAEQIKESLQSNKRYTIDFAMDKNIINLATPTNKSSNNNKTEEQMDKFLLAFVATFGAKFKLKEGEKPSEEQMLEFLKDLKHTEDDKEKLAVAEQCITMLKGVDETATDYVTLLKSQSFVTADRLTALEGFEKQVEELNKEKETLTAENASLKKDAEIGKKYSNFKRAEAVRLYKAVVGADKAQQSVIDLFNKADDEAVDGLLAQYTKGATEKFSGSCADCGSHNFKFQSSFTKDTEEIEVAEVRTASVQDLRDRFGSSSMLIR